MADHDRYSPDRGNGGAADILEDIFGVAADPQSYLNVVYHLLGLPLGTAYFVFLVTGISLGLGLLVIGVGLLILLAVLLGWYALAAFEREMVIRMLRVPIPPMSRPGSPNQDIFSRLRDLLRNPITWKSLFYLFARFPLGIFSFSVAVTAIAFTVAMVTAPLTYKYAPTVAGLIYINTQNEAILCSLLGLVVGVASLHLMNGLAYVQARFAKFMLGSGE
ncbi:MAG: sensor domain-containing protein [Dehalococcoidales bacterium]|nr:sensor domain-containing protein [Dehalococcoidales bacterium]